MIVYENERSNKGHTIYHQHDKNLNYPVHMHNSFEFICVFNGILNIVIENKNYALRKNQCAIILPDEAHYYYTENQSESYLCIFSTDYAPDFQDYTKACYASNPVFTLSDIKNTINILEHPKNIFQLKGVLYRILAEFSFNTKFYVIDSKNHNFIKEVLLFIENNYSFDITLHDLADKIGYTYNYLSSLMNKIFKTSFPALLNECRISHASEMLTNTDKPILEIASLCGYNSLRNFNRKFLSIKKMSPKEFRNAPPDFN